MTTEVSVILVEDDEDLRDSVVEWLKIDGMHVTAVSNAAHFYQALSTEDFQIAVIDIGLPDQSGYVLAEYLRANTNIGIILLTARSSMDDKLKGYGCGADHYLIKPVDCRELSAVIVSIAQRMDKPQQEGNHVKLQWTVFTSQWSLGVGNETRLSLSVKELKFLTLLAVAPGQPVLRKTVLHELYQRDDYHCGRSLDSLVRRLRSKIASHTGLDIPIRTVHAIGYCFTGNIVLR